MKVWRGGEERGKVPEYAPISFSTKKQHDDRKRWKIKPDGRECAGGEEKEKLILYLCYSLTHEILDICCLEV